MAFPTRSFAALLLTASVVSCSDVTGRKPTGSTAHLALKPGFSPRATEIVSNIRDFGLTFDHVHVQVFSLPDSSRLVYDTTVAFTPDTEEDVRLDVTVPVQSNHQAFKATVQYLGGDNPLFQGSGRVFAYAPDETPSDEGGFFLLDYVGPGANVVSLTLSPNPMYLTGSGAQSFSIAAFDSAQHQVAVPPVIFSSSDPAFAVAQNTIEGLAVIPADGETYGSTTITAMTPIGRTGTMDVIRAVRPSYIYVYSGEGQTGEPSTALPQPLQVRVLGPQEQPLAGVTVVFSGPTDGSSSPAQAVTNDNGIAQTTVTLGPTEGPQAVIAIVGLGGEDALTATAFFTAVTPGAFHLVPAADTLSTFVSLLASSQYPAVRFLDGAGNGVNNESVRFSAVGPCAFGDGVRTITEGTNADGYFGVSSGSFAWSETAAPASCAVTVSTPNRQDVAPLVFRIIRIPETSPLNIWTGASGVDDDWSNALNWWGQQIPASGTTFIPENVRFLPRLRGNVAATFSPLLMEGVSTLDLNGNTLTVDANSSIYTGTGSILNGTVVMTGGEQTTNGVFPNLTCEGGIMGPGGDDPRMIVTGTMRMTETCRIYINNAPVRVGNLVTENGPNYSALQMYENALLSVEGNVDIGSNEASQQLSGGIIALSGDFTVQDEGRFWSTGTAVHLLGSRPTVHMSPRTESSFWKLYIDATSTVTFDNAVYLSDTLYIANPATLNIQTMLNSGGGVVMANGTTINVANQATITLGAPFRLGALSTATFAGSATLNVTPDEEGRVLVLNDGAKVVINGESSPTSFVVTANGLTGLDAIAQRYPGGCIIGSGVSITGTNTVAVAALSAYCLR